MSPDFSVKSSFTILHFFFSQIRNRFSSRQRHP